MPKIDIIEQDLTVGGGAGTNLNVVYIPGLMSTTKPGKADAKTPILCSKVTEFEKYFGTEPFYFTTSVEGETTYTPDKSYVCAKELISLGLPVLYESVNDAKNVTTPTLDTVPNFITGGGLDKLKVLGDYEFKYLTSGGYPSFYLEDEGESSGESDTKKSFHTYLSSVADARGDCIALIDHQDGENIDLAEMYTQLCDAFTNGNDKCAAFTPWVTISCPNYKIDTEARGNEDTNEIAMPPSFAYLSALANSIKTNASWLAVAGAARGQIPNFKELVVKGGLSNKLADSFQNNGEEGSTGISINPITNIKPFGYRIWGNRTLKKNNDSGLTATSFLNTRNMVCDIKQVVYNACREFTFEQNNDVLWLNFKSRIEPTLNQMKTGAGLSGYKIIRDTENAQKAKLKAIIKLYPLYAVEDFEITVQMLDNEIAVS